MLIACVCAACGGSGTGLAVEAHCNPLGDGYCLTPWPSSVYEVDDATTATQRRVAIPAGALPSVDDTVIDPSRWNRADGFSPSAPIIVSFKAGVSPRGLPPVDNMDLSLSADSATVILDMTTGERVAHYATVDSRSDALLLHPAKRLASGHRYAVAITNRVTARDGEPLDVPAGFTALRFGYLTDHHLLEAARPRLDEALDALDTAGVSDDDLIVAWDFTVASEPHDLDEARARVIATPAFDFAVAHSARNQDRSRTFTGALTAPLITGGSHHIAWRALVPACVKRDAGITLYGHSLLGDAREVDAQGALAAESCRVIVGADLGGLSSNDVPALVHMFHKLDDDAVLDELAQGIIDQVALVQALRGEVRRTALGAYVDPSDIIYYGASQHTGVLAVAPVSRGVLTGGEPITSRVLDRYRELLALTYPQPLDATLVAALLQMRWDAFELIPAKPVLLAAAAEPGTTWHARSLELPVLASSPFTPWGLPVVGIHDTGVGFADKIRGYAPCCALPPCASNSLACSALPRLP